MSVSDIIGRVRNGVRAVAQAAVPRKAFTDRLGLPADASNAEVLAAVDKVTAARAARQPAARNTAPARTSPANPEDALYARLYPQASAHQQAAPTTAEDALYARLYPKAAR